MKIAIASDIHLEFGDVDLPNKENADVLILAGDICVARDLVRADKERGDITRNFFQRVSRDFPNVIYVMGNHEHYSGDFAKSESIINDMLAAHHIHNVFLLERNTKVIDGVTFVGGTLWTDFNNHDPLTIYHAEHGMNDYRGVKNTGDTTVWKFLPKHALGAHMKTVGYITSVLENRRAQGENGPVVVVGHHAPSHNSIADHYKRDKIMNGCFASNLEDVFLNNPEINIWIHGHTHEDFDYKIGETRVICNPRGYIGYETRANNWNLKHVEI